MKYYITWKFVLDTKIGNTPITDAKPSKNLDLFTQTILLYSSIKVTVLKEVLNADFHQHCSGVLPGEPT